MKLKNILLIVSISLLSIISCVAGDIKIDSRYSNVGVELVKNYHSKRTSINNVKGFYKANQTASFEKADKVAIQVVLNKGTAEEIKLAPIAYDAKAKNRSSGQHFEDMLSINGQDVKIAYSTKVKYGTRGKSHPIVKSVEVKIPSITVNGQELITLQNQQINCVAHKGDILCTDGTMWIVEEDKVTSYSHN